MCVCVCVCVKGWAGAGGGGGGGAVERGHSDVKRAKEKGEAWPERKGRLSVGDRVYRDRRAHRP